MQKKSLLNPQIYRGVTENMPLVSSVEAITLYWTAVTGQLELHWLTHIYFDESQSAVFAIVSMSNNCYLSLYNSSVISQKLHRCTADIVEEKKVKLKEMGVGGGGGGGVQGLCGRQPLNLHHWWGGRSPSGLNLILPPPKSPLSIFFPLIKSSSGGHSFSFYLSTHAPSSLSPII